MKIHPLTRWRYDNGDLSRKEAAEKLGWSPAAVQFAEDGTRVPGQKLLYRMIRNLKVSENEALRLCGITKRREKK